jgi:NTP pyrophosphatase (non-canonical NTP hydrolase)
MSELDSLSALTARVRDFGARRAWAQFHDPKNLVMALASEVGELSGLFRWVSNRDADAAARGEMRSRLEAEIGDVGILLLALCDRAGVDPGVAINQKLALNEQRYPVDLSAGRAERPT